MGFIERVGQYLRESHTQTQSPLTRPVKEWSLEKYRESIEAQIAAEKALQAEQTAQRTEMRERQKAEQEAARELSRSRREQAKAFRRDSGIDAMLSRLYELVDRDPAKHGQKKGHIILFKPRGSSNHPESVTDFVKVSPRKEERSLRGIGYSAVQKLTYEHYQYTGEQHFRESFEFDEDAIFDVIILGEHTSSHAENNNVESDHYAICLVTETTPYEVIAFHSVEPHKYGYNRVRDIVPKGNNYKRRLEGALFKAFNSPYMIYTGTSMQDFHNTGHVPL